MESFSQVEVFSSSSSSTSTSSSVQNLTLISSMDHHGEESIKDCPDGVKSVICGSDWSFQTKLQVLYSKYPVDKWKANGFYDDSLVHSIDEHWLKFDPQSSQLHISLAIIYTAIMCVGLFGNLLVIIMFSRCRSLRTPANYLILNLAVADGLLLSKIPIFIFNSINEGPAAGYFGCQFYGFFGGLMGTASIMTLMFVAIDRYYVIVFPLNPFKKTTHRRAIFMIVLVWIYSITFAAIPFFLLDGYVPEGILTSCSFDYLDEGVRARVFVFVYFLAAWVLPITLIVYSYVSIFRMVVQAEQRFDEDVGRKSRKEDEKLRKELKIAMVTTVIVLLWLFAWTPYATVALLGIFDQRHLITPLVSSIPAIFCKLASAIDPFVYTISHPRFKRELLKTRLKTLCVCLAGSRARRNASKDTSSHYYSATCIDQSEEVASHCQSSEVMRLTTRSDSYSYSMASSTLVNSNKNSASGRHPSSPYTDNHCHHKEPLNSAAAVEEKEVKLFRASSFPNVSELEMNDRSTKRLRELELDVNVDIDVDVPKLMPMPISISLNLPISEKNVYISKIGMEKDGSASEMIELIPKPKQTRTEPKSSQRQNKESREMGVQIKRVRICSTEDIEGEGETIGDKSRAGAAFGPGVYSPIISSRAKTEIPIPIPIPIQKTSLRNPKSINRTTTPPTHTNYLVAKSPKVGKNDEEQQDKKREPPVEWKVEERKRQETSKSLQTSLKIRWSESSNSSRNSRDSRETREFIKDLEEVKTNTNKKTKTNSMTMTMKTKPSSRQNTTIETSPTHVSNEDVDDDDGTEPKIEQSPKPSPITMYKSTMV